MTEAPIHDQLKADWSEAIASAEIRGRLEVTAKVLSVLKPLPRPQQSIKQLIAELDSESWKA
jgi:hypothetical protein